jgi:hypothetical protein
METNIDPKKLPDDLTPLNLNAYLTNAFAVCGCAEKESVIVEIVSLLEWHKGSVNHRAGYQSLYNGNVGVFYLLAGWFDALGLSEHGTGIRYPWLTPDGERLLAALKSHTVTEIESASGEAYDGLWYGD